MQPREGEKVVEIPTQTPPAEQKGRQIGVGQFDEGVISRSGQILRGDQQLRGGKPDFEERSRGDVTDAHTKEKVGETVVFRKIEDPNFEVEISTDAQGRITGVVERTMIPDSHFGPKAAHLDLTGGRLGKEVKFNGKEMMVGSINNRFDRNGRLIQNIDSSILPNGTRQVTNTKQMYDGETETLFSREVLVNKRKSDGTRISSSVSRHGRRPAMPNSPELVLLQEEVEDHERKQRIVTTGDGNRQDRQVFPL